MLHPFLRSSKTIRLTSILIFLCLLFTDTTSGAIDEYELFQEGYDLYLSCQPSRAVEKFEVFLKEFPDSSAKDSVLFWLGKALIQMGKLADSIKVFNEIKSSYPKSPFNYQAGKEVEKISSALKPEIDKPSDMTKINDREFIEVKSERDRLKVLAEEYKKKIESYENIIAEMSVKEKDLERIKNEKARLEEKVKDIERSNRDSTEYLKRMKDEKDKLMAETEILRRRILSLENVKKDLETKDALLDKKQKEIEGLKTEIDLLTKKIADKENIETELRKEIDSGKKRIEDYNNKLIEMVKKEKEAETVVKKKESLINKLASLEKELSSTTEEAKKIKDEKERLDLEILEMKKKFALITDAGKELERKEAMLREMEKEIKELKENLQNQQGEQERLREKLQKLAKEKEGVHAELQQIQGRYNDVLKENELLKAKSVAITDQINQLKEKIDENKRLQNSLSETEKRALALETERAKTSEDLERLRKEKEKITLDLRGKTEEVELLKTRISELGKREGELIKEKDATQAEVSDLKERLKVLEGRASDINKLTDDIDRLRALLSEEKKKYDEANSRIAVLEQREKELLSLNATMKDVMEIRLSELGQRLQICEKDLSGLHKEKADMTHDSKELKRSLESLTSEVLRLRGVEMEAKNALNRIPQYEARIKELERVTEDGLKEQRDLNMRLQRKDEEISRLLNEKKELEATVAKLKGKEDVSVPKYIVIGKERFSLDYILSYMFSSQLLLSRIGVRNIPWRRGDLNEDFISEHILYEEAKKLDLKDRDYEEFNRKLNLQKEELEYLGRFNMISNLINLELKKLPPERSGEAVVVRCSDKDKYERAIIVADIQNRIKSGFPIKDIVKLYPDVEYMRFSDKDINKLFGDLSGNFSDNEVVSTFNQERYMIVKIRVKPLEYKPFDLPDEESNKRLREFISELVSAGRTKKEIKLSD